jgi:hypothetical protein
MTLTPEWQRKPSASEIDRFLLNYQWEPNSMVEQIEIKDPRDSSFQFYMFAIHEPVSGDVRLVCLWPNKNAPTSDWT